MVDQLRDIEILAAIALLFVLTLQVLWLTSPRRNVGRIGGAGDERVREIRLLSSLFWVDARMSQLDGKWLASADTPDGPSLGLGRLPHLALVQALAPFAGVVDELMESVPDEFYWTQASGPGLP